MSIEFITSWAAKLNVSPENAAFISNCDLPNAEAAFQAILDLNIDPRIAANAHRSDINTLSRRVQQSPAAIKAIPAHGFDSRIACALGYDEQFTKLAELVTDPKFPRVAEIAKATGKRPESMLKGRWYDDQARLLSAPSTKTAVKEAEPVMGGEISLEVG